MVSHLEGSIYVKFHCVILIDIRFIYSKIKESDNNLKLCYMRNTCGCIQISPFFKLWGTNLVFIIKLLRHEISPKSRRSTLIVKFLCRFTFNYYLLYYSTIIFVIKCNVSETFLYRLIIGTQSLPHYLHLVWFKKLQFMREIH